MQRAARQAQKLRRRLGGSPALFTELPPRPAGMHYATYERLCYKIRETELRALQAMADALGNVP